MPFKHKLCLAPMLDWTDRHFRYFIRVLAPHCVLYTEMVNTNAVLRGETSRLLDFSREEHPLALQLGGSDPQALAQCTQLAWDWGYDEVNLNIGCPSERVQNGRFGACLMQEPSLVAECIAAMCSAAQGNMLISAKCRLGVDAQKDYAVFEKFMEVLQTAGCDHVIVHARNAWLQGLSPKENRDIPALNYAWVYQVKAAFPALPIIINGGIKTVEEILTHLAGVDGVMLGRAACDNPYLFCRAEAAIFSEKLPQYTDILARYTPYMEQHLTQGVRLATLIRPILALFNGLPGSRYWRRYLSEHMHAPGAGMEVVTAALAQLRDTVPIATRT